MNCPICDLSLKDIDGLWSTLKCEDCNYYVFDMKYTKVKTESINIGNIGINIKHEQGQPSVCWITGYDFHDNELKDFLKQIRNIDKQTIEMLKNFLLLR